jgi:hypothetical protein
MGNENFTINKIQKKDKVKKIKLYLILNIALSSITICNAQKGWNDKNRILPDSLRLITASITVYHSPNSNYPILNDTLSENKSKYIWKHSTYVRSENQDLEIIKAGSFIWYSEKGWYENIVFDKANFAEKFNCKNGILKKGKTYCFKNNNRFGDKLFGGDALWYIIAKDKNGNICKGIGLLETESIILNK